MRFVVEIVLQKGHAVRLAFNAFKYRLCSILQFQMKTKLAKLRHRLQTKGFQ